MSKLLYIDVSPRGDYSVSRNLGNAVADDWLAKHSGGRIILRDLSVKPLPLVDLPWIAAAFSTPDQHTPEQKAAIKISDELVDELLSADEILIATPMYNFNMPAALKLWLDHIVRLNRTFNSKYEGLAKGKKVSVILSSGADYSPGSHAEKMDFFSSYLRFILGFIGITDVTIYLAGGTRDVAQGKRTLQSYLEEHKPRALDQLAA
jgi:FMN-dependent NADH-azoreductase